MPRKFELPFRAGQEVEATFTESGYRGAWFRCRVLDTAASEPRLLLRFLDFPDEDDTWARVRVANPAVKSVEAWTMKKRPLTWIVRPVAPVIHERGLDKYREDVRLGRRGSDHVHVYNDKYSVGDMVDWWKDDVFWGAQVLGVDTKSNEAKIKLPLPPLGEGNGKVERASIKNLRPCFTWSPMYQWREQGNKQRKPRTGVENCKSDELHIWRVDLPGGESVTPGAVSDGPVSSESTSSVKSEPEDREKSRQSSDPYDLTATSENVYDRVKMRTKSTAVRVKTRKRSTVDRPKWGSKSAIDVSVKPASLQEVKEDKSKRKVHFSFSDATSKSDGEEETSPKEEPEDIHDISKHGVANVEEDMLKEKSTTHENGVSAPRDAVVPELVGEKVESLGSCLTTENADGSSDQTGEVDGDGSSNQTHFTAPRDILKNSPTADGPSDVAKAIVCSPEVPREEDSSTITYQRKRSLGSCVADRSGDQTGEVDGDGSSNQTHFTVTKNSDGPSDVAKALVCSPVLSEGGEEDSSTERQHRKRSCEEFEDELDIPQKRLCQTNTDQLNDGREFCFGSVLKQAHEKEHMRQPDIAAQVLNLGLGIIASRCNVGLKRKQVCDRDPGNDSKRMRADVEGAPIPAPLHAPVGELPRMRGAIKVLTEVPEKMRESRVHGRERPLESVGFQQQQQQVEDRLCGHTEQKLPLKWYPTNSRQTSGSNYEIPSHGQLDKSEVLDDKSEERRSTQQPSWVIRDGKLVCTVEEKGGSISTREESNRPSIPKEKCPVFPVFKEKPLNYNTLPCKSCSTVVEPTAAIAIGARVSEASAGLRLETLSLSTTRGIEKVVNVPIVKTEAPQPVAAAVSEPWVHDTVQCCIGKEVLNRVILENLQTRVEVQVAAEVKSALWQGLCCSSGLGSMDLLQRVQLLSRMHFETWADGDKRKVIVSTGKPGEQLYLGHYETDTEFGVARRIVSRCKKELHKAFMEKKQVLRVTNGMQTTSISRDFGPSLTKTEILPKPSLEQGRHVSFGAAAGASVIVLDDDDVTRCL